MTVSGLGQCSLIVTRPWSVTLRPAGGTDHAVASIGPGVLGGESTATFSLNYEVVYNHTPPDWYCAGPIGHFFPGGGFLINLAAQWTFELNGGNSGAGASVTTNPGLVWTGSPVQVVGPGFHFPETTRNGSGSILVGAQAASGPAVNRVIGTFTFSGEVAATIGLSDAAWAWSGVNADATAGGVSGTVDYYVPEVAAFPLVTALGLLLGAPILARFKIRDRAMLCPPAYRSI